MWQPKNPQKAREVMIENICKQKTPAPYEDVKAEVEKVGGRISESTYNSIRANCDAFNEYSELAKEQCRKPFSGDQFPKVVECLKAGGNPKDCFKLGRKIRS